MNKSIIAFVLVAFTAAACQSKDTESNSQVLDSAEVNIENKDVEPESATPVSSSIDNIITEYLNLKNALAGDNSTEASKFGKNIVSEISKLDVSKFTIEQKEVYDEVMDDAKEQSEHIGDNSDNLSHQREHFALLSRDLDDLIAVFETKKQLYQVFCPMYDDKKGAIWLSEFKEIKNPYFGSQMLTCGSIQKEL